MQGPGSIKALTRRGSWMLFVLAMGPIPAWAHTDPDWLLDLSLPELAKIRVITASKSAQRWSESASAVHVITQADIRHAGVTTMMEALRLAPGVNVARITSSSYAISIRGLNNKYSPKLLVMIDGRSIYNSLFGGVNWQAHDLPVEEIERIEVVRGPGATLWGSNAVNGVINIITRAPDGHAHHEFSVRAGNEDRGIVYGSQTGRTGKPGSGGRYRVYGSHKNFDEAVAPDGSGRDDQWYAQRIGFRTDNRLADGASLTLIGTAMNGHIRETGIFVTATPGGPVSGPHRLDSPLMQNRSLLGRWESPARDHGQIALQAYYQSEKVEFPVMSLEEEVLDLDLQHEFPLGDRHRNVWGLGVRHIRNNLDLLPAFGAADPESTRLELFSGFYQVESSFRDDTIRSTVGVKVEQNDYTDIEWQPGLRLNWLPTPHHSLWSALSRAVRIPSTGERQIQFVNAAVLPGPTLLQMRFDDDVRAVEAEKLTAFEVGYRFTPHDDYAVDLALFYNEYSDLASLEPAALECSNGTLPPGCPGGYLVQPLLGDNSLKARTRGGELVLNWDALEGWRLSADYSFYIEDHRAERGGSGTSLLGDIGTTPRHTANLRSAMDVSDEVALDLWYRYVDRLRSSGVSSYHDLSLRLGYRIHPGSEISVSAHNLLDPQQREFAQQLAGSQVTEFERSVIVGIRWEF